MVNGDPKLFTVEPKSGRITTVRGLDYEAAPRHTLVVGTLENTEGAPEVGVRGVGVYVSGGRTRKHTRR